MKTVRELALHFRIGGPAETDPFLCRELYKLANICEVKAGRVDRHLEVCGSVRAASRGRTIVSIGRITDRRARYPLGCQRRHRRLTTQLAPPQGGFGPPPRQPDQAVQDGA